MFERTEPMLWKNQKGDDKDRKRRRKRRSECLESDTEELKADERRMVHSVGGRLSAALQSGASDWLVCLSMLQDGWDGGVGLLHETGRAAGEGRHWGHASRHAAMAPWLFITFIWREKGLSVHQSAVSNSRHVCECVFMIIFMTKSILSNWGALVC